jgi:hypothetical protein
MRGLVGLANVEDDDTLSAADEPQELVRRDRPDVGRFGLPRLG